MPYFPATKQHFLMLTQCRFTQTILNLKKTVAVLRILGGLLKSEVSDGSLGLYGPFPSLASWRC